LKAGGARRVLLPVVIKTVKNLINDKMDAVVEELKEESADVTEQSVLGSVIDEVQEKVQVTAPVFYDLVKTVAWSKEQEERNTLKDPTKASTLHEFGS
jgi:lipase chaperone LimK